MKYLITGGAGFIGSNLAERLLADRHNKVAVLDNFSIGKEKYLIKNTRLKVVKSDIENSVQLLKAMSGCDCVFHFASNSDISKSIQSPAIDFYQGTMLTHYVLEAMRKKNVKRIIFPSGSGVYGDAGEKLIEEDYPYKIPVSTYGAGKLASESLIAAYSSMYGIKGSVLRFANVVGRHQTHGVIYDFVNKLKKNPSELKVLGNGTQKKSYIYIDDILDALMLIEKKQKKNYDYYNVSTGDYATVKQIAKVVTDEMGIKNVKYIYGKESIGWKGDVSVIKLSSAKIKSLGWKSEYSSSEAIRLAINDILDEYD